jgi:hypothetical protein
LTEKLIDTPIINKFSEFCGTRQLKTADEYLENVRDCRYFGTAPPNLNCVTKEIKSRLNTRNVSKYSV